MTVMVVDVYVCGLFTNSRHNASLGSTGTWPRVSWPSEASVPRVSWASRHLHVQGRLALALLAPSLVARALALRAPALGKAWLCARGRRQTALAKSFCFCSRSPSHVCPPKALFLLALRVA